MERGDQASAEGPRHWFLCRAAVAYSQPPEVADCLAGSAARHSAHARRVRGRREDRAPSDSGEARTEANAGTQSSAATTRVSVGEDIRVAKTAEVVVITAGGVVETAGVSLMMGAKKSGIRPISSGRLSPIDKRKRRDVCPYGPRPRSHTFYLWPRRNRPLEITLDRMVNVHPACPARRSEALPHATARSPGGV